MATKRRKETYTHWDPADNLKSEADIRAYLIASFAEAPDDAAYIAAALGDVARARGMTNLAKRTGLTRMGLYKALSKDGPNAHRTGPTVARRNGPSSCAVALECAVVARSV
jgi:probable addiction module antidote protein